MTRETTSQTKFEQMNEERRAKYWESFKLLYKMPVKPILEGVDGEIRIDTRKGTV